MRFRNVAASLAGTGSIRSLLPLPWTWSTMPSAFSSRSVFRLILVISMRRRPQNAPSMTASRAFSSGDASPCSMFSSGQMQPDGRVMGTVGTSSAGLRRASPRFMLHW